jgi:ABC-type sulfate transport system permease subunit
VDDSAKKKLFYLLCIYNTVHHNSIITIYIKRYLSLNLKNIVMKKIATLVLFLIGAQIYSNAQTAEEIIKTYIENIGGEEALRKIKNVKMTAKVNAQGMSLPLEMINMSDGRTITKFEFQGKEMIQGAFDGETAWGVNFMTQKAEIFQSLF